MIKFLKNTSGDVLRLPALKKKFPVDYVWQIPYSEIDIVMTSLDTLTAIRSGDLQVGWSDTDFFSDATEGEAFLLDTFVGVNTVVDGATVGEIIPGIVTDIETGKKTTEVYFQILKMLRELYNDASNPLYKDGFESVLDKLTTMLSDISTLQTGVGNNAANIEDNTTDITGLQTDVGNNSDAISTLQSDVGVNTGNISTLQTDVGNNTTNVAANAGDITTLQTDVANNSSDISTNAGDIATLQTDVGNNASDITALQSDVSNNTSNISTNTGDITSIQSDVAGNTADIATNAGDISAIQTSMAGGQDEKEHLERPHDLLIYYGWLNSFNSDVNGWNNEKVAQDMARYNIIVIGDGIQDSGHGDYANTQIILPRVKALNPNVLIFGYVTVFQDLTSFQTKADQWDTLEIDGIFMDEAGYDYGTPTTNGRDAFNTKVDYVHGLNYATLCFVNAWNMDHAIGTENDASYPNTTYNTSAVESNLDESDWFLLESFAVNSVSYADNYEAPNDWFIRGNKAINHRDFYDINLASVSVIENTEPSAAALFHFAFTSGLMCSLDAVGTSDASYGAGSAKVVMWERPDITGMGRMWAKKPNVLSDLTDADAYIRMTDFGRLSVDFTDGSEDSEIIKN